MRSVLYTTVMAAGLAACASEEGNDPLAGFVLATADGLVTEDGAYDVSDRIEAMSQPRDHDRPTDLAFNPEVNGELWVVNRKDDSVTIISDAGTSSQESEVIVDPFALHFMEEVTSIAFGAPGTFATCQDSRNTYNDQADPNDFMGPTLWSSDPEIFGLSNPDAVEGLTDLFGRPTDLGSHLDMLHESPRCMGIAWDRANVYWVFDGFNGHIVRYDFAVDHGPGWDDHSDGVISRHVGTDVKRVPGVVSHLVLDHDSGLLYVADTGNNRIMVLDTNSGRRGADLAPSDCWRDPQTSQVTCADYHEWRRSDWLELVDGASLGMVWPAGIELIDDTLFVTDAGTNEIMAFDLDGELIARASTGILEEKALAGIFATSIEELWFIDSKNVQLYRLEAEPAE